MFECGMFTLKKQNANNIVIIHMTPMHVLYVHNVLFVITHMPNDNIVRFDAIRFRTGFRLHAWPERMPPTRACVTYKDGYFLNKRTRQHSLGFSWLVKNRRKSDSPSIYLHTHNNNVGVACEVRSYTWEWWVEGREGEETWRFGKGKN